MGERVRFWRWYRAIPITLMALMLALSVGLQFVPSAVIRGVLFPVDYATQINASAVRHDVDPYLVAAVIKCESNWDANAQSSAGAVGLMQIMPTTAREVARMGLVDSTSYSYDDLTDPTNNIEYGTAYLGYLEGQLGDTTQVIAAYNAGLGAAQGWNASSSGDSSSGLSFSDRITYPETRLYVQRVSDAYEHYQELYPEGLTNT